jgi:hypothetical protein
MLPLSLLGLALASPALAQSAGSIIDAGDTLVSGMMVRSNRVRQVTASA